MTEADLAKVHTEMKRFRIELKCVERALESLAESLIPQEKVSPEEMKEVGSFRREAEVEIAFLLKKC